MLGLGPLVDSIHPDEFANLSEKYHFAYAEWWLRWKEDIPRKIPNLGRDSPCWPKKKIFPYPCSPKLIQNFGDRLHEGELAVVTGVASVKDSETRLTVEKVESVDESLGKIIEESTWLIDPMDEDAAKFLADLHKESERGRGRSRVSIGFAESGAEDGMVVQMDERFRLRLGLKDFSNWRKRSCVLGVRVKLSELDPPVERKFGRKE